MSIFKSAFTVSFFIAVSRVFGFIRDVFIANFIGANYLSDVFFAAFRLPNFFRRVLGEGALNASFVPIFIERSADDNVESKNIFAQNIFTILIYTLLIFTLIFQIFMPFLMAVLFPGFKEDPMQFDLLVDLSRITIFYLIFISLVSLCSSILNSMGRFAVPASAPIILNIVLILSFFTIANFVPNYAYGLSWGIFIAGLLQFTYLMFFTFKSKVALYPKLPKLSIFDDSSIKKFFKKLLPAVIGGNVMQINLLIDSIFASLFASALSYLYYADRINQLPLAMIGIAIGIALLPSMSRKIQAGDNENAISLQNQAMKVGLLLVVPASLALIVLAQPIVSTLFERGKFSANDSHHVARALQIYAIGLPAYVLVKVMEPGFFARGNTKTPMKIAIFCLFSNLFFNTVFYLNNLSYVGIALSSVVSSYFNFVLLTTNLIKKRQFSFSKGFVRFMLKIIIAAVLMVIILSVSKYYLGIFVGLNNIIELTLLIAAGALSYFFAAFALGCLRVLSRSGLIKKKL